MQQKIQNQNMTAYMIIMIKGMGIFYDTPGGNIMTLCFTQLKCLTYEPTIRHYVYYYLHTTLHMVHIYLGKISSYNNYLWTIVVYLKKSEHTHSWM